MPYSISAGKGNLCRFAATQLLFSERKNWPRPDYKNLWQDYDDSNDYSTPDTENFRLEHG